MDNAYLINELGKKLFSGAFLLEDFKIQAPPKEVAPREGWRCFEQGDDVYFELHFKRVGLEIRQGEDDG